MSKFLRATVGGVSLAMLAAVCSAQPAGVGPIEVNAEAITVSGNGHHKSYPCNGRKAVVEGSDHVVSFTGPCSQVDISGANNKVDAEVAPKGKLIVAGANHTVRWKSKGEPTQDLSGIDNKITRLK